MVGKNTANNRTGQNQRISLRVSDTREIRKIFFLKQGKKKLKPGEDERARARERGSLVLVFKKLFIIFSLARGRKRGGI